MAFDTEPTGYEHGIVSDLQGAWEVLRQSIVDSWPFPDCDRLLFHVDEAMSWESVCDLDRMARALLIVRNLTTQASEVSELIDLVTNIQAIFDDLRHGNCES